MTFDQPATRAGFPLAAGVPHEHVELARTTHGDQLAKVAELATTPGWTMVGSCSLIHVAARCCPVERPPSCASAGIRGQARCGQGRSGRTGRDDHAAAWRGRPRDATGYHRTSDPPR